MFSNFSVALERKKIISSGIILLFLNCNLIYFANGINVQEYWAERAKLLFEENAIEFGSELKIEENEKIVNEMIMREKNQEIDEGKILFQFQFIFNISRRNFKKIPLNTINIHTKVFLKLMLITLIDK